jgi:hypothetical protein
MEAGHRRSSLFARFYFLAELDFVAVTAPIFADVGRAWPNSFCSGFTGILLTFEGKFEGG